ncbi:HNH endonuclease [Mycobacterium phage DirtMonster]|uniref:DOD-type homing endonuclease domain-containing protein n=3 Tax=Bixzunavirus TaxID=680114 RepID=A0A1J0MA14_9CAUD|nr:exonuclease [Mycobacterium phage Lukilu]AGV99905.1 HNH endonuclease [Mycobacterium phage Shrimp]AOZ63304.1 HNH endonuclease [Mycobacterium phage Erdmann]AOZ63537.1 HNH endonuclease [Mycobacterium phage Gabriel]AVI04783.1 HNH endonuclease [Mycobacterium phage LifeSavor]AZF97882.1 HNH endonuclease [Mycobacterium phage Burrough]QAY07995.1 HNH endonuclease [Mycobacterium phage EmmaElysia]QAY08459.1 HNH endonuclease [Mycobacterium phage Iota]QAY13471.1 HNH endonuclease [Mycobacterium phage Sp
MGKEGRKSIFRSLAERDLLIPYFRNALLSQEWPDEYTIKVDSSPYYGKGDGYFHPSTHALMPARQLYYHFHPETRDKIVQEDRTITQEMTLTMGSAIHAVVQTQFQMAGLIKGPDDCEVEYVDRTHHVRGRVDFIVHHPNGQVIPVELKSLACSTPILTTNGWSTMGALQDGDEVYAPDGQPTKVIKAHPINLNRPCFKVRFRDGQEVVTDAEHLWQVNDRNNGGRDRVMTTQEIADAPWGGRYRFRVPVTEPLQTPEADLPVDPWLLGAWLGDGDASMVSICSGSQDLDYLISRVEGLGLSHRVNRYGSRAASVYVHGMRAVFSELGLLKNKHIPDRYLTASVAQRRQLLAGLMDSDGTVSDRQVTISMKNERLMRQVLQLVRSLGYRAGFGSHMARLNGRDCGLVYVVRFHTGWGESPFDMPRKRDGWEQATKTSVQNLRLNAIVAVEPVETVPVRCITVAHESSLYVAGEGFVPTHNTQNSRSFDFQDTIKPIWDAQLSLGLHGTGHPLGILLVVESGYPFRMREYRVPRNDQLLTQIFQKFDYVRECIALNKVPEYCCMPQSKEMDACPARYQCWLKDKVEAS